MADLHPHCSVLPLHPTDLDDDGAMIRRREVTKSKLHLMYLSYGFLMAEIQPPNADFEIQFLDPSRKVEAVVVGGEMDENGDRIFEIYFSQDNRNYLLQLAFIPEEDSDDDDEDLNQEEEEELGSDCYRSDGEETYEDYESDDEDEQIYDDQEMTGNRDLELYFPQGDRSYFVRLVFEIEEGDRIFEEAEQFLFVGLQRAVGILYEDQEEEEVSEIDNKSSNVPPEVVSEISRKLMEVEIGESGDIRTIEDGDKRSRIIVYPAETARGSKNEIGADHQSSSGTFVDSMKVLEPQNHLIAI